MQLQQFPQRHTLERSEAPGMLIVEELLGVPRRKALNHTQTILRMALYVNSITGGRFGRVPQSLAGIPSELYPFVFFYLQNHSKAPSNCSI
jgi:hypothetical protein